jgi:hypothetical protein
MARLMRVTKIKLNPWNLVGIFFLGLLGIMLLSLYASPDSDSGVGWMALVFFGLPIIFFGLAFYLLFSLGATEPDGVTGSAQVTKAFSVARIIRIVAWVVLVAIAGIFALISYKWA